MFATSTVPNDLVETSFYALTCCTNIEIWPLGCCDGFVYGCCAGTDGDDYGCCEVIEVVSKTGAAGNGISISETISDGYWMNDAITLTGGHDLGDNFIPLGNVLPENTGMVITDIDSGWNSLFIGDWKGGVYKNLYHVDGVGTRISLKSGIVTRAGSEVVVGGDARMVTISGYLFNTDNNTQASKLRSYFLSRAFFISGYSYGWRYSPASPGWPIDDLVDRGVITPNAPGVNKFIITEILFSSGAYPFRSIVTLYNDDDFMYRHNGDSGLRKTFSSGLAVDSGSTVGFDGLHADSILVTGYID